MSTTPTPRDIRHAHREFMVTLMIRLARNDPRQLEPRRPLMRRNVGQVQGVRR